MQFAWSTKSVRLDYQLLFGIENVAEIKAINQSA